ncbi:dynein regulatory complex protein 8 isoform X3 [Homo sapiens]|uniref:dynein regulatory complex protein 8 isoform X3 n=1 Tax=Homo sapiens TaxID=9606 RepID=UPI001FB0AC1C|nr:dynein regulatory complex protein 8 isoform X3 [Homo sapiens]
MTVESHKRKDNFEGCVQYPLSSKRSGTISDLLILSVVQSAWNVGLGYNSDEIRPRTLLIEHLMEGGRRDHHTMTVLWGTQEIIVAEFHKKIKEAFEVFDHESNNTVDVREIGTIIRSLGCCPTEGELHDLIAEVEEEEPTGYIRFEKFLPVMTEILLERKYRPIPEDVLLRAFEVLDSAKRGFLTKDELIKYMTEEDVFQILNSSKTADTNQFEDPHRGM